ncbi:hypothetical protein SPLA5a_PHROGS00163 [Salmonella phage SPLA5a]|nr:hypothetical protein SPLA5a_PHROGS00163 [Salmonella phage SPLA5a]
MKNYFNSRALARTAAKANGGKVIDNGTAAPAGKRWQVIPGFMVEAIQDTADQRAAMESAPAPVVTLEIKAGYRNRQAARVSYVHDANGKPIPVTHKRSQIAARLAAHMAR